METTRDPFLTAEQRQAVSARGNVLVLAGAGTGKTHTLVERCLDCLLQERAALDEILVVTFTEAAAAEMRRRLRAALEDSSTTRPGAAAGPAPDPFFAEQLALFDAANIGTLHGFCFKLVREHFYELGLEPQPAVLDEGEARLLADETLDEALREQYEGRDELAGSVQNLIQIYGGGRDEKIRALVLRLHHYSQTRPDPAGWLARQIEHFSAAEPAQWRRWLPEAIAHWRSDWLATLPALPDQEKAAELTGILRRLPDNFSREAAAEVLGQIIAADAQWPPKRKGVLRKPLEDLFEEAEFLLSLAAVKNGKDPLAEDWTWTRGHMTALLRLAQEFEIRFSDRKRADGVLDFHDLEQFALKLLWDFSGNQPTAIARRWREKLRFVFVDEYQDINAAQDKIIQAVSREGAAANRFFVGDVKQSIYRFRLADPKIFRDYAKQWRGDNGRTIPLTENFRSREGLLHWVNSVFERLMREDAGGVNYDAGAALKFGSPETRAEFSRAKDPSPRAELHVRLKKARGEASGDGDRGIADLSEVEQEARLVALRLRELKNSGHEIWDDAEKAFRPVEWRDLAVLLRSPAGKSEAFARQFERAGVPLAVVRGGFYDRSEILDLLSLLKLLDNPLQDEPAIAVMRSPLAGCSLDELAEIRLAAKSAHFWTALNRASNSKTKIRNFLERFSRWRRLVREAPLSECLERIVAETHYADWLRAQPRGAQRRANVEQLLNLAQKFDGFQRQGLFRFLKFIAAQQEAEIEPEIPATPQENAVRLMSIHQSKGLEFPVVALADLAKPFNLQDLHGDIILDEDYGLCPLIQPAARGGRYPALTHWLARRHQRRELLGEELRLLYVAMTRARDTLILSASITERDWETLWMAPSAMTSRQIISAKSAADWLGLWFGAQSAEAGTGTASQGEWPHLRWRLVADAAPAETAESGTQNAERELPALDDATMEKLRTRLAWEYPFPAATERRAKSSVTALRREAEESDDEAEPSFPPQWPAVPPRKAKGGKRKLSAAEIGSAHHKFLQHFSLPGPTDLKSLADEARRLESEGILSADERAALDLKDLAAFWDSEIGAEIRRHGDCVKRELPFTAKFSPAELAPILGKAPGAGLEGEWVVVQGVADLVVLLPREIRLVDFKTNDVRAGGLAEKEKQYTPQLKLYAAALGRIYARPVTHAWLHFLSARKTLSVKT